MLIRQGVNWWLGYVLCQPVDIDLNVVAFFARNYVGIETLQVMIKHSRQSFLPQSFVSDKDTAF